MNKIGICILAMGDEHIKESLNLICSIKKIIEYNFDYYVVTDKPEMFIDIDIKTKKITESFNYNLKRLSIEFGLEHTDTIFFLDSDNIAINNVNFNEIKDIKDGFYGSIFYNPIKDNNNEKYYDKLFEISKTDKIPYFFEHNFLIKLSDVEKRKKFIENWNYIFEEIKDVQTHSKGFSGSGEGIIIGLSCVLSEIEIIDIVVENKYIQYFNVFHHYCEELDKSKYFKYI
jgi:hypothetical protein